MARCVAVRPWFASARQDGDSPGGLDRAGRDRRTRPRYVLILVTGAPFPLVNIVAGITFALLIPYVGLTVGYLYFDARVRAQPGRRGRQPPGGPARRDGLRSDRVPSPVEATSTTATATAVAFGPACQTRLAECERAADWLPHAPCRARPRVARCGVRVDSGLWTEGCGTQFLGDLIECCWSPRPRDATGVVCRLGPRPNRPPVNENPTMIRRARGAGRTDHDELDGRGRVA